MEPHQHRPHPQALCDQAVTLHQAKRFAEAERLYLEVLGIDPANFTAQHLLGVIRHQQGRSNEALELIGAALQINPDFPAALSNYGLVLKTLGRMDEALQFYARALDLNSSFVEAWNNQGIAFCDMNRFDEALASYDKALDINPAYAQALGNRARVLQYLGKLEEAAATYADALAMDPTMTNVMLDYADAIKVTPDNPHLKTMEVMRHSGVELSDQDVIHLDFALGKAHEDLGNHERSFRHLLSGNALKRSRIYYDEAATLGFFDRIEEIFTEKRMREKESLGGGNPSPAPIFIVGMMRSGSTLVEQILASHPRVHGAGELPDLSRIVNSVRTPDGNPYTYPEFGTHLDARAIGQFGTHYLNEVRRLAPDAPFITDKMPSNYHFAGLIHLALPNARIIHTVRDPVDNCISCFSKLFIEEQNYTYDLAELGRYYRHYEKLMTHWKKILPPGRILDVRYEDLVNDFEAQSRRILEHCGLDWDPRCLQFHKTQRPVRTASVSQVRQPIYQNAVGRARGYEKFLGPLKAALAGN